MTFGDNLRSVVERTGWDKTSQVCVLLVYLENCMNAESVPNPPDFARYLGDLESQEATGL